MNEVKNRKSRQSNNVKRRVKQPKKNIAKKASAKFLIISFSSFCF